ncbi:MAG: transcriptional regulator, GntR family [Edaphobacter sp.]|nr:transcriptional regulator, GntR family [Edaphobacter sp.]
MELTIPLSKNGEPLFRQVYLGLRQAILVGNFAAGGRLPSTRDLAQQLGISRTVVLLAYDQLLAEGFAVGHGGSGTYVFEGFGNIARVRVKRSADLQLSRFGLAAVDALKAVDYPRKRLEYPRQMFLLDTRATIPDHNLNPFFLRVSCFTNLNVKNSYLGHRVNGVGNDI